MDALFQGIHLGHTNPASLHLPPPLPLPSQPRSMAVLLPGQPLFSSLVREHVILIFLLIVSANVAILQFLPSPANSVSFFSGAE